MNEKKEVVYSSVENKTISSIDLKVNAHKYVVIDITDTFICDRCHNKLSFKKTKEYISILCNCGCRIFYPPKKEDGLRHSSYVTKKEYRGENGN